MSQSFSYDLSVSGSPDEARSRLREVVTAQLHESAKMGLASEGSGSMAFRPEWHWPLLVAASRRMSGEAVTLSFTPDDGGTHIAVSGKVGGAAEGIANRDFWAKTLGAA